MKSDANSLEIDHPKIRSHSAEPAEKVAHTPKRRTVPLTAQKLRNLRTLDYAPRECVLQGRPLEVAQLVALGLADKEIAHVLAVSEGTAKGHVSMILGRLGLYRRTQICRYVHEAGLLPWHVSDREVM